MEEAMETSMEVAAAEIVRALTERRKLNGTKGTGRDGDYLSRTLYVCYHGSRILLHAEGNWIAWKNKLIRYTYGPHM